MIVTANVVDLYHRTEVTSFREAAAAGVLGVIHKASTGATGRDPRYRERRRDARAAGLLWGAYHWGTAADVAGQVENFLAAADPGAETLVALDLEETPGNQMTLAQARDFLGLMADRLGRRPVIYGGAWLAGQLGEAADPFLGAHRLWLGHDAPGAPVPQRSWPRPWLWQFAAGDAVRIPGIPGNDRGEVDCNHHAGTEAALRAEWAS